MKIFIKYNFILLFVFLANSLFAQIGNFRVQGQITNDTTGAGLDSVEVSLISLENNKIIEKVYTTSNGKYKFKYFPVNSVYKIQYSKKGYIGMYIIIEGYGINDKDARELPLEINSNLYIGNADDYPFLKYTPYAIATYDKNIDNMEWNIEYIKKIKELIDSIKNKK